MNVVFGAVDFDHSRDGKNYVFFWGPKEQRSQLSEFDPVGECPKKVVRW